MYALLPHILIGLSGLAIAFYSVIKGNNAGHVWKTILVWPKCFEFFVGIIIAVCTFWLAIQQISFERDLTSKITGGDSYCYLQFNNYRDVDNLVDVFLRCDGEYPVFDLVVEVNDMEKIHEAVSYLVENQPTKSIIESMRFASKNSSVKSVGTMLPTPPNSARPFDVLKLPDIGLQRYFISITARNGAVGQFVRFKKVHGNWVKAEKIQRGKDVIQKLIDDDFPKDAEGGINWQD